MQASRPPPPRDRSAQHPGSESDSWIEIPPSPSPPDDSDDSAAEIITSGLRIRRRRPAPQPPHSHLAETIFINPLSASYSSISSEDEGEASDVASFLAEQPLSSSEFTTDDESGEDGSSDEGEVDEEEGGDGETVFDSTRPYAEKARLEMEHDAALRASLSTLLSCAAAARGLPRGAVQRRGSTGVEGLRVVQSSTPPTVASVSSNSSERGVRRRKAKKAREQAVRSTLLTIAISAGAIVVLSAVSFGAGYLVRQWEGGVVEDVRRARVKA